MAVRQFQSFGVGDWWLPLTVALPVQGIGTVALWWPLVGVAAGLFLLRLVRDGAGVGLAAVRAWVRLGDDVRWGVVQSVLMLSAGAWVVMFLGMPAAVSELLILLGCVGVASYLARQAAHANLGIGPQAHNLVLVGAALTLAVGGSVMRGDLGHALVAMILAACFAWMFGWRWLRVAVLFGVVSALAVLAVCLMTGEPVGPLGWLVQWLPPHAQDRIEAMFDPFQAGSSDLARVRWLMQSAGLSGWGLGYAPWQGIAPSGLLEGLPLQGPSDYVLALTTTLWGHAGGLLLMTFVLTVFACTAMLGLRTALRAAMPPAVRWLAALGGLGCVVMAAKVVLSVGGVTGVLPLTGLPVGLLGYGPVTHLAALLYLTLALGTLHVQPIQEQHGVNVQAHQPSTGAVRERAMVLAVASVAGLGVLLALGFSHLRSDLGSNGHRFITYEVTVHLKEFIDKSGKSRQMMTDIDYESILKRVADKTGHGSVQSLWHYIDLAWEELGVWANTDKALARLHAFDQLFVDGLQLKHELETSGKRLPKELQPFLDRLVEILMPAKEHIEGPEPLGKT